MTWTILKFYDYDKALNFQYTYCPHLTIYSGIFDKDGNKYFTVGSVAIKPEWPIKMVETLV